ncbi:ectoine/hydroxyectoine ABC transporter permease subunit EhuC [Streptomyces boncukensis]|uniref:Ectoine/hydroxyectoine ABC transporter permease subunit EhuC n=1 Tax=Streptomyces boncukensis TaxID=2711219 RepID=A0A6G4WVK1_9ACTN|nr:ectoine/hydroxyectoine ABC transporter permease subunit EhuC [Streptomyces boncukensis]NGO68882.1 ectoine/hydroxyectoine ABC transporter permease subunit EhuC [Streptomyces boncukensis]
MTSGLWELVLKGIWITVQLTVFSSALALAVAFAFGILRTHRLWIVRFLAGCYIEVFRGTSALVFMFWIFFVLPLMFSYQLVPMWAAVLALGLTYGAYGAEVVRGALQAVAPAQREAGVALSFTRGQQLRKILIPQAWPEMIPPFNNLSIELLKGTALVSIMGVGDTAFAANLVRLALQESAEIYTYTLLIYFVLAFVISRGMRALERKAKAGIGRPMEKPAARKPGAGVLQMLKKVDGKAVDPQHAGTRARSAGGDA